MVARCLRTIKYNAPSVDAILLYLTLYSETQDDLPMLLPQAELLSASIRR